MKCIVIGLTAAALAGAIRPALSQNYPTKPIRIIAPFAPGGGTDFIARVAAQKLSEALGQQVIVENRPGAGGMLGAEIGAKSPPDGYTLPLIAGSYAVNPSLFKLNFDPVNDITRGDPALAGTVPDRGASVAAGENHQGADRARESKTEGLNYASSGVGSITHLATELFVDMAGIKMVHVPYKGTGPAITDTIAGQTQVLFGSMAAALPQMKNGRFKGIAVTTPKRIDGAPEIPTVSESGLKGYEVILWHGLIGPKGLPKPILDRVNRELNKVLQNKDMQEKLAGDGVSAAGGTPEQFAALIKRDIEVWRKVVQKAGVKAE